MCIRDSTYDTATLFTLKETWVGESIVIAGVPGFVGESLSSSLEQPIKATTIKIISSKLIE